MSTKICSKCGVEKARSEFSADKGKPDGLRAHCKACHKVARKVYRDGNLDKERARYKAYYDANRHKVLEKLKVYREANRHKVLEQRKAYYAEYRARHGVSLQAVRYRRDPQARLAGILRSRLHCALNGKFKTGSAVRDLGMPIDAFLTYLNLDALDKYGIPYTGNEQLFHIDHIKPLVSFDLQDPEQLRIAVRWDNLQVLRAKENLRKGAKCPSQLTQNSSTPGCSAQSIQANHPVSPSFARQSG